VASSRPLLTVVAPAYNEAESLPEFVRRIAAVMAELHETWELLVVNDGSRDHTRDVATRLCEKYPQMSLINFSRNFGHEMASSAGLSLAQGQAVVLIDSDLQDPPELIPQLVERWRRGAQVVYAQRRQRKGETSFKKLTSWLFYRFQRWFTGLELPPDTGDFRLLDQKVVEAFCRMPERQRFVRGMITWLGFRSEAVEFDRSERFAGATNYSFRKLIHLTLDSVFGFTTKPLQFASRLGFLMFTFGAAGFFYILCQKLFPGLGELVPWMQLRTPGYALLMCSIFLMSGLQFLLIGLMGEYIGRIYQQVQDRPMYVVESIVGQRSGGNYEMVPQA
jgi:dolichol-phosphate mannosyltransferase